MANYQQNPPFGGGFYPQYPQQNQPHAPYNMMHQQQFMQPQHRPPPMYNQMPQPGPHVFQNNAASFAHNNQYHPHGIPSGNAVPPPPPPQFFGNGQFPQFPPSIPPPPFPPHPLSQSNQPYHASMNNNPSSNFGANSTPTQPNFPHFNKEFSNSGLGYTPLAANASNAADFHVAAARNHSEYSPGYIERNTAQDNLNIAPDTIGLMPMQKEQPQMQEAQATEVPQDLKTRPDLTTQAPLHSRPDTKKKDSPPQFQVKSVEAAVGTPEQIKPQTTTATHTSNAAVVADRHMMDSEQEALSKREAAKTALLQLQDQNIGFKQLCGEFPDIALLRKLYTKLGVSIDETEDRGNGKQRAGASTDVSVSVSVSAPGQATAISGVPVAAREEPEIPQHARSDSSLEPGEVDEGGDLPLLDQKTQENSAPAVSDTAPQPVTKTPPDSSKSPTAVPQKKPVERKDYIARLLAAKQSVKKGADKVMPTTPATQKSVEDIHSSAPPSAEMPTPEVKSQEAPSSQDTKKPEVKDSVQTQLVRQRLEALKNSSKTAKAHPTQLISQQDGEMKDEFARASATLSSSGPEEVTSPGNVADTQYTPTLPFFAASGRAPFGALPGLSPVSSMLPGLPLPSQIGQSEPSEAVSATPITAPSAPESQFADLASNEKAPTTRKRAIATDFIDSPPRQTRRRIDSNDPVVIEVSDDDEDSEENEADAFIQESLQSGPDYAGRKSSVERRELRSLPPLTNVPSSASASSAANTPPTAQTPRALAAHEEKIKALHQRIQEMELRKKAKRALAGKQMNISSSKTTDDSLADAIAEMKEDKGDELNAVNKQLVEQKTSLGAIDAAVSAAEEKLQAEEQAQAMIVARAESELQGAAVATTIAEKQVRLDRKAALEAALPKMESQLQTARNRLEDIRRQQTEIELEIEQSVQGRNALHEELEALRASESEVEQAQFQSMLPSGLQKSETPVESSGKDIPTELAADDMDHEVPDSMPREPSSSSSEKGDIEKDTAGPNETLLEDVMDISSADEGQIISSYASPSNKSIPRDVPVQAHTRTPPKLSPIVQQSSDSESHEDFYDSEERPDGLATPGSTHAVEPMASDNEDYEPAAPEFGPSMQQDLEDSNMSDVGTYEPNENHKAPVFNASEPSPQHANREAISKDAQEYEPSEHHEMPVGQDDQQSSDRLSDDSVMSGTEDYEPELNGPAVEQIQNAPISIASSSDDESASMGSEASGYSPTADQQLEGNVNETVQTLEAQYSPSASQLGEGEVSDDALGNSDYEPPEPSFTVDNLGTNRTTRNADDLDAEARSSNDSNLMEQDLFGGSAASSMVEDDGITHANGDATQDDSFLSYGHFTPYESPLSQFPSYRFHPQYVSEVPGGFRSLTYSHKIDHSKFMCKWELAGGICNDSSCTDQHFRDITPTGSAILIDMIGIREGKNEEEKQEYVNGLKQAINDMQKKNINDVDSVAAEIVAYRRRFLGDSSRVLANLD